MDRSVNPYDLHIARNRHICRLRAMCESSQRTGNGQFAHVVYAVICGVGRLQPNDGMNRTVGSAPGSQASWRTVFWGWARACPDVPASICRVKVDQPPVADQVSQGLVFAGASRCIEERQSFGLAGMHIASEDNPERFAVPIRPNLADQFRALPVSLR